MQGPFRTAIFSAVGAAAIGTALGLATTGSIRSPAEAAEPIYPRSAAIADPAFGDAGVECIGCSRYDDGYRWASAQAVTEADACFGEDWSYQRGCLAYVAATRVY